MIRPALVLLLGAVPLAAQSTFEGTVSMTVTPENGAPRSFSYMLKDGKMRFDPGGAGGPPVSVIIDPIAEKLTVIMPMQKVYMESDFAAPAAAGGAARGATGAARAAITRTGRMETIAGYKCEHVTVTDQDGTAVDSCISTELGGFRMPAASNPMSPQREPAWITQLGGGVFPLQVQKGGHVLLQVTSIEKKTLDASLFAPPAGFQAIQMPMSRRPPRP